MSTDNVNMQHFAKYEAAGDIEHTGTLPVASYRLATNEAYDGETNRGAYSFCMCPGELEITDLSYLFIVVTNSLHFHFIL